jgi:hypothetical protein
MRSRSISPFYKGRLGALQRLLWRETKLREQLSDCGQSKTDATLLLDQLGHHRSCPQSKVQTVLVWGAPITTWWIS